MGKFSLFAKPIDDQIRNKIYDATLWHYTKPRFVEFIDKGFQSNSNQRIVHLKAAKRSGISPFKRFRDWSVHEENSNGDNILGYIYLFVEEPILLERINLACQGITSIINIQGSDVLKICNGRVFYRSDRTVVIRGEYIGPGKIKI